MRVPRITLGKGYSVPRVINGTWQLSGGHSGADVDRDELFSALGDYVDAGLTAFDCGDIYTGVEALLGDFFASYAGWGGGGSQEIQVHTKLVPDLSALDRVDRGYVRTVVERSLARLRVPCLDLVQFHWWDPSVPGFVEAAKHLRELQDEGRVRLVGVTNLDTDEVRTLVEEGVEVVSNQVQYSLLDSRPEREMVRLCSETGLQLLCYGVLAGGFLSDRYRGTPDPEPPYANRSLVKYRLVVEEYGGWASFQALLEAVGSVARRHGVGVAAVAARYVLDRPEVAAVILGVRHGRHLAGTLELFDLHLDPADLEVLEGAAGRAAGPPGGIYSVERIREGPHGVIMRYDLNRIGPGLSHDSGDVRA